MGIGMQLAFLGFDGSAEISAGASVELVRLHRFYRLIGGCHLAIEAWHGRVGHRLYNAQLDLITRDYSLIKVDGCTDADPQEMFELSNDADSRAFDWTFELARCADR